MAEKDPWDFSEFGAPQPGHPPAPDSERNERSGRSQHAQDHGFDADLGPLPDAGPATSFAGPGPGLAPAGPPAVAGPPLPLLGASAATAVIGLVLAAVLGALPPAAIIGWVLAGPLAIGALAVYTSADTRRRAQPIYVAPNWLTAGYYACLAVCLIGVIVSAVRIALWVGRW